MIDFEEHEPQQSTIEKVFDAIEKTELANLLKMVKGGNVLKQHQIQRLQYLQRKLNSTREELEDDQPKGFDPRIIPNDFFVEKVDDLTVIFGYSQNHIYRLIKENDTLGQSSIGYSLVAWYGYLSKKFQSNEAKERKKQLELETIRLRKENADIAEYNRKVLEQELVNRKENHEEEKARFTEYRQALRGLGAKVSAQCVGKSSAEIQAIVDSEYKRLTNTFVDRIRDRQAEKEKKEKKNKKGAGRPSNMERMVNGG